MIDNREDEKTPVREAETRVGEAGLTQVGLSGLNAVTGGQWVPRYCEPPPNRLPASDPFYSVGEIHPSVGTRRLRPREVAVSEKGM
jgi:hypothetical protein